MLTSASAFLERIKPETPVMETPVRRIAILAMLGALSAWSQTAPPVVDPGAQTALADTMRQSMDDMDALIRKSMLTGSSKPVSFSGEALVRFIGTTYDQFPSWMATDETENKNSVASVRVAMVAAPQRNLRLWSKIAFNADMYGNNLPTTLNTNSNSANGAGQGMSYYSAQQTGYFSPHSENVYEDMCAGLIASIGKSSTSIKLGGVLWTEASPLTVWKGQNREFGWDYLPFELEQSPAQYYEYAESKGEKSGRAAWNKKPFQGIQWESIDLPGKLYFELTYGYYEGYQKWQPNYLNPSNTNALQYTGEAAVARMFGDKAIGTGDDYHHTLIARLARQEFPLPGNQALPIQVGFNYVNFHTDPDYPLQYGNNFSGIDSIEDGAPVEAYGIKKDADGRFGALPGDTSLKANYFLDFQTASIDFRQTVPGKVNFLVDIGMSQVDTSFFKVLSSANKGANAQPARYYAAELGSSPATMAMINNAPMWSVLGHSTSPLTPAVYAQASDLFSATFGSSWPVDLGFQSVYAPKQFYSGTSFITPQDAFFPFEANLVGAGKFAGADNGTPYVSNEAGANFTIKSTRISNGHLRVNVGYHSQLEDGSDLLWIPWRLNGTAFDESQNQSSTQYDGMGLTDDYLRGNQGMEGANDDGINTDPLERQVRRFGNDFYFFNNADLSARKNPYGITPGLAGGIRNDFLSTFEDFGLFRLRSGANYGSDTAAINAMINNGDMPQSQKATQNISLDLGKDISGLWSGHNPLFMDLYAAANGVSAGGLPLPSDNKTYLSGYLLRFEPVYQLAQNFWLIGLLGQEQWYSRYGVAVIDSTTGYAPSPDGRGGAKPTGYYDPRNWHAAPIDYLDRSYGVGFDWAMTSRVELHTRLEYFTHKDRGISATVPLAAGHNDYEAWLLHAETKMWF
jgi:hypothetical protein